MQCGCFCKHSAGTEDEMSMDKGYDELEKTLTGEQDLRGLHTSDC